MAAQKLNYVILYKSESQVYGSASKDIALQSPPPEGVDISDKRILFITYQPDNEILSVHQIPIEEVMAAELKYPTKKVKEDDSSPT